jgi:hypothetical protein
MMDKSPFAHLKLDTFLLLILITPHMWFNPVSNVLLVMAVATYVLLDVIFSETESGPNSCRQRALFLVRLTIVFFVIMAATLLPTGLNILQRRANGPETYAHDGLIQTEIAIEYLLTGQNPYTEDYTNTPMAAFPGREPPLTEAPLYHNAYLPFLFFSGMPLYWLSQLALGWYDQRFLYLLALFGLMLLLPLLVEKPRHRLALLLAVGLNFLFTFYLADGRNDIMILFWLAVTAVCLSKNRISLSALALGLAMTTKHQAWFFLPFYLLYLLPKPVRPADIKRLIKQIWPLVAVLILIIGPFLIWDLPAFIDDTVTYISGSGPDSFPIKGWGFSSLLLTLGLIPHPEAAFPFALFELLFGLPVLYLMLRRQWQDNTLMMAWLGYAFFGFTFQFFSRFFSDNYFVFLLQIVVIALFMRPIRYQPEEPSLEPLSQGPATS